MTPMKYYLLLIALAIVALFALPLRAQHTLQFDDGGGHYGRLSASGLGPAQITTFTFPASGGLLLTSTSVPGLAWVLVGNSFSGAGASPAEWFGTATDDDVIMKANGVEILRLVSGGGVKASMASGSSSTDLVTSNAGVLETRTASSLGFLSTTLTDGNIWIGNGSNVATEQTLGGDLSMTNAGVVTVSKFHGTGSSTDAVDLATAEVGGVLAEANGGTNQSTYASGDILYASALNTLSKLAIGSTGDILTVTGGVPVWASPGSAVVTSATGVDAIKVNGDNGPHPGAVTISLSVDATLTDPSGGPLGIALGNANSWIATQTFSSVAINGGAIEGTTVGLTTPSTVNTTGLTMNGTTSPITLNADPGTAGYVMTSGGSGATPTWTAGGSSTSVSSVYTTAGGSNLTGNTNDLDVATIIATLYRIENTTAGPIDLTGLDATGSANGRVVILHNIGAQNIVIKHQNAGSLAPNRFDLPGGADILLAQKGVATFAYDTADSFWKLVSTN
jgi:hypothetical protein